MLVDEKEGGLVWPVLRQRGSASKVQDGGGRGLIQTVHVMAALRRLRSTVQPGRHQTVLVLSPCDLEEEEEELVVG